MRSSTDSEWCGEHEITLRSVCSRPAPQNVSGFNIQCSVLSLIQCMLKNAIMIYHYTLDWYVLNGEIVKLDQSFPQEMGTMGKSRLVSR